VSMLAGPTPAVGPLHRAVRRRMPQYRCSGVVVSGENAEGPVGVRPPMTPEQGGQPTGRGDGSTPVDHFPEGRRGSPDRRQVTRRAMLGSVLPIAAAGLAELRVGAWRVPLHPSVAHEVDGTVLDQATTAPTHHIAASGARTRAGADTGTLVSQRALVQRRFAFFSDPDPRSIEDIASVGVGGVGIGPYFVMRTSLDSSCGTLSNASEESIVAQMIYSRSLGLHVILKPMVDAQSYPRGGGWRADIAPTDPGVWFEDYHRRAIAPFLPYADEVVLYTEITGLAEKYPDQWLLLIAKMRAAGFQGGVISDSDLSTTTTPWFPALTWLGGSFYPTIDLSSDAAALRSWQAVAGQMAEASRITGLPIYMAELGPGGGGSVDLPRWITSMGEVLGPLPFWAGFLWWRWPQEPREPLPEASQAAFRAVAARWATTVP